MRVRGEHVPSADDSGEFASCDGRPVAARWYIGSMKSGPALNACTLYFLDRADISPVAMEVFPTPLPVPAITKPFTHSPLAISLRVSAVSRVTILSVPMTMLWDEGSPTENSNPWAR